MLYYLGSLAMGTALCAYCIKIAMASEAQVKRDMLVLQAARMFQTMNQQGAFESLIQRVERLEKQVEAMHEQLKAQAHVPKDVCEAAAADDDRWYLNIQDGDIEILGCAVRTVVQKLD